MLIGRLGQHCRLDAAEAVMVEIQLLVLLLLLLIIIIIITLMILLLLLLLLLLILLLLVITITIMIIVTQPTQLKQTPRLQSPHDRLHSSLALKMGTAKGDPTMKSLKRHHQVTFKRLRGNLLPVPHSRFPFSGPVSRRSVPTGPKTHGSNP